MTDLNWLALSLFAAAGLLAGVVLIFTFKVKGLITVSVTQPPIHVDVKQPDVTVHTQAPHSVLPPELMDLMQRLNEKLSPPTTPAEVAQLDALVLEAVEVVEHAKGLKGPDKFRNARAHVLARAAALRLEIDDRSLALSIESAVAMRRVAQKLLPK